MTPERRTALRELFDKQWPGEWQQSGHTVCIPTADGLACFRTERNTAALIVAMYAAITELLDAADELDECAREVEKRGRVLNAKTVEEKYAADERERTAE